LITAQTKGSLKMGKRIFRLPDCLSHIGKSSATDGAATASRQMVHETNHADWLRNVGEPPTLHIKAA